jgi:hypothetical protein
MKPICIFSGTLVTLVAALVLASPAAAEQPFERCSNELTIPGPAICDFTYDPPPEFYPAGTRCDFDVTIDYEYIITIYYFDNPPRAVAHVLAVGTATGNGHTLIRTARFTDTASPPFVLTQHGLLARYSLPGGGTITVWAGYQRVSIDPPLPDVFHGNPSNSADPRDIAALCAALT